jgi:hypothetical protein
VLTLGSGSDLVRGSHMTSSGQKRHRRELKRRRVANLAASSESEDEPNDRFANMDPADIAMELRKSAEAKKKEQEDKKAAAENPVVPFSGTAHKLA